MGGKIPSNIIRIQSFVAQPDTELEIGISEIIFLMPIFRLCDDRWIDATGDYDLCMSMDGTKYTFVSRRPLEETYGYRFFSVNWLANRLGRQ